MTPGQVIGLPGILLLWAIVAYVVLHPMGGIAAFYGILAIGAVILVRDVHCLVTGRCNGRNKAGVLVATVLIAVSIWLSMRAGPERYPLIRAKLVFGVMVLVFTLDLVGALRRAR